MIATSWISIFLANVDIDSDYNNSTSVVVFIAFPIFHCYIRYMRFYYHFPHAKTPQPNVVSMHTHLAGSHLMVHHSIIITT